MYKITPEMIAEMECTFQHQEKKLLENGWIQSKGTFKYEWNNQEYESDCWVDPRTGYKTISCQDAYFILVGYILADNGWKTIIEHERVGELEWDKPISKWARYQSPKTKRVYTYLDALYIMESDWNEEDYRQFCSRYAIELNNLIGDNFNGDHIYTWFHKKGEEFVLELREPD